MPNNPFASAILAGFVDVLNRFDLLFIIILIACRVLLGARCLVR